MEKAILVVSFGTSYNETRKKTLDRIEEDVRNAFPEYGVFRAWTSGMIRSKLLKRDGVYIPDVKEALEKLAKDGVREVIVQPTHMINGYENDAMAAAVESMRDSFERVSVGAPLLSSGEDNSKVLQVTVEELHPGEDEALVLMGHGTEHYADAVYAALDYRLKDMGHMDFYMGTVEGYPPLESVVRMVKKSDVRKVLLAPFMIVAGDHAMNDLSGDAEGSWKSVFEREGYEVRCILKGLGEYEGIRRIFLDHIRVVQGTA